jgi:CheY-like chemotaxis protein
VRHCEPQPQAHQHRTWSGNILVAEDNPSNQLLITILLKKLGLTTTIANNGREAVEQAESGAFRLIFMDVQMPVMNGFEATRLIHHKGIKTPIIALTANAMKGDKEKCLQAGCDGYITKPIDPHKLETVIAQFLDCVQTSPQPAETAAVSSSPQNQDSGATIVSELAADPDLRVVAEMFIAHAPDLLKQITDALGRHDLDELKRLAHTLKGSSGSAGFPSLSGKARDVETSIAVNAIDDLCRQVDEINAMCNKLSAEPAETSDETQTFSL